MSEWITHRPPTAEDADDYGDVLIPRDMDSKPDTQGCVKLFQNYPIVTIGQRWWPLNAEAEQAAIAEQEAAAAEPEPTPEPAAEPPPAVAGLPKASDHQLWGLQRAARERARPGTGGPPWDDSYLIHQADHIAAHRILYDHGYRSGHYDGLHTPTSDRQRDLTLLQEENAGLKSDLKDLLHSRSCPEVMVVGDLEGELKRRGEWSTPAQEPAQPEPTPATRKIIQIAMDAGGVDAGVVYCSIIYALCSDGSLWNRLDSPGQSWEPLPAIPQGTI